MGTNNDSISSFFLGFKEKAQEKLGGETFGKTEQEEEKEGGGKDRPDDGRIKKRREEEDVAGR